METIRAFLANQGYDAERVYTCDTNIRPTGTGYFDPFLRVNRDGTGGNPPDDTKNTYSSGWNTDASKAEVQAANDGFNDFDDSWTSSLELSEISMVNAPPVSPSPSGDEWEAAVAGSNYALFTVDINQISSGDGRYLTLNQLLLYDCDSPDYTSLDDGCTSFFNLFGDSGQFINFNYRLNNGSGSGDIDVYIQNDGDYAFGGPYIALLDGWGCANGDPESVDPAYPCSLDGIAADNDGFQEWATTLAPNPIPEPASLFLLGSGLSAAAFAARRRARAKKIQA